MKTLKLISAVYMGIAALTIFSMSGCKGKIPADLPNILWITSEDDSPYFGCYGDSFATTPNFDKLASEGFLYTHAYANAPVCAPARNTIITGVYANSNGNQHMRSNYKKSEEVKLYPQFLRKAGYYCTNNSKEDYNILKSQTKNLWDESSRKATYKNRKPGQPFFAVFNLGVTHESCIHKSMPTDQLRHDPQKVALPPYHPDTPEMRHDWAQFYDKIEDLDTQIGQMLAELEKEGLAENTIVFYCADHGGILARSKRYVYETGTRVPFIIRIPEKYKYLYPAKKPGSKVNRLVSFVDMAPTFLSIAGIPVPDYMQGHAFLGQQKTPDPRYAYMFRGRMDERYDMCRAVRDQKYRYIHNYMPYRIYGQHLEYLWRAPSIRSWEKAYREGKCNAIQSVFWNTKPPEELYDTENDPWEVHNLAGDPNFKEVLLRMRNADRQWMEKIHDAGFIPEADLINRAGNMSIYDYMRSGEVPLKEIMDAADLATLGNTADIPQYIEMLNNKDSGVRYWGATGLLILKGKARPAIPGMIKSLNDESADVVVVLAEALYDLGEKDRGIDALLKVLKNPNQFARLHALNAIDCINEKSTKVQMAVINMLKEQKNLTRQKYDLRAGKWLLEKWGIDATKYNIKFNW